MSLRQLLELFCLANVFPEVVDKEHLRVKDPFLVQTIDRFAFLSRRLFIELPLQSHEYRLEEQSKIHEKHGLRSMYIAGTTSLFEVARA